MVVDEYVTIGRKAQVHHPAVVAVAVDEYVIFGQKAQVTPSSGCDGGSGCQRILDSLLVVHGIVEFALESTLEILMGGNWSSLVLARIAAGKEDENDADADNKNESDLSHEMSEDQGLADLSRQLDEMCSPLNSINNNESDLAHKVSEDQGLADLSRQLEEA